MLENFWTWLGSGAWVPPVGRVLSAAAIAAAAFLIAKVVGKGLRRLRAHSRAAAPLIYIVERLAGYAVVLAGLFIALSTLGVNLTSLTIFAGAIGVGVGLGLQGVVREFVSGLVVIFDPLVSVGDFVELDDGVRGEVAEVGPRATRLRTNDGLQVVIPNSKLIESRLLNWTYKGDACRIHVPFSVAYGVDKAVVRDVVVKAAQALPFTRPDDEVHKSQVWMTGFGESGLEFELVVWPTVDAVRRPSAMRAAYTWAIDDALRQARIEIPYPQMDVRFRSVFGREGDAAMDALRLDAGSTAAVERGARTGGAPNDAADTISEDAHREAQERESERRSRQ